MRLKQARKDPLACEGSKLLPLDERHSLPKVNSSLALSFELVLVSELNCFTRGSLFESSPYLILYSLLNL